MKNLYTQAYMNFLKTRALIRGDRYFKLFEDLRKEQWLPAEKIEKLQIARLKKLVTHATTHSTFFKAKYSSASGIPDSLNSLSDLPRLPLLTRRELQDNYDDMLCPVQGAETYADSSGGSTGRPVNFYHNDIYKSFSHAFELLFMSWHDIARGDRTAVFWGADRDFKEWSFREKLDIRLQRTKMLNSFNVSEESLAAFLAELEKFKPVYIYGYATSLYLAARYINRTGRFKIRPRAIRSSAETLFGYQRREIEKAFDASVSDFYGSREVNNLAAECPKHEGLHVFASGKIVEIVDENGRRLEPGQYGYIAVTDLTDFSFPFIRYLNGDMGVAKADLCSCGRGYPLLREITGRSSDVITLSGKFIHGEFFTHLFYARPEVRQFQVIQESDRRLVVKIVTDDPDMDISDIKGRILSHIGGQIELAFEFVDHIAPLKSGKFRFTINKTVKNEGAA